MARVLVIDDDPLIPRLVGAALKENQLDHSIEYCSDGGQGRLKAAGGGYDLIVLDLNMPFMDGVAALEDMKLNPKSAATPVIVLTALTDSAVLSKVKTLGAVAVIHKPFQHWDLANAVRLVLAGPAAGKNSASRPGPADGLPPARPAR